MWITSRSHYGLITMTELARSYGHGPVPLSSIAQGQQMPMAYLEQLVSPLRKAGLVRGTRGRTGGLELMQPPAQVTVKQVVQALDGDVAPVECVAEDYQEGGCVREPECTTKFVWQRLKDSMNEVLESVTLADLTQKSESALQQVSSVVELLKR